MSNDHDHDANCGAPSHISGNEYTDPNPPTIASFAPISSTPASRSQFQVNQKSPLLVATPPQITRALSRSYPYLKAANHIAGLLTWTSKDPWESFLLVAAFWATALYGDIVLHWAGNVFIVVVLVLGMYLRRYHDEPTPTTLDEILETLNTLITRLNIFFEPFLTMTRWLSTTKTATTDTTRPALTTLFVRILLTTPLWLALSIYPAHIITTRRIVLTTGTLVLSWHSRPAKVSRTVLWRSQIIRVIMSQLTGLSLMPLPAPSVFPPRTKKPSEIRTNNHASSGKVILTPRGNPDGIATDVSTPLTASMAGASPGVKFTFAIYENQRRWLGVGWTASLFAYERTPFTDEHLQPAPSPKEFELPETPKGSGVKWRWVKGDEWRVEGARNEGHHGKKQDVKDKIGLSGENGEGWVYYDNKWRDGHRGVDGWGKYTRRRKWYRNAELVENINNDEPLVLPVEERMEAKNTPKPEVVIMDVDRSRREGEGEAVVGWEGGGEAE